MTTLPSKFLEFLLRAKKNTYAADGEMAVHSRPNSKDLHYQEGDYLYIDTYLGGFHFIGEEVVWIDGAPTWGMNYYGKMLIDEIPDGFSKCLKSALLNVPEKAPYRGPASFSCDGFEYRCTWHGNLFDFHGEEQILQDDRPIYKLNFHGGEIQ